MCTDNGPFRDVFSRGSFSDQEKDKLSEGLTQELGAVVTPEGARHMRGERAYLIGRRAMTTFVNFFDALPNWLAIDQAVRVIAYFGAKRIDESAACDARAFDLRAFLQTDEPTYAIHVNLDALPVLHQRAINVLRDGCKDEIRDLLSSASAAHRNAQTAAELCAFLAVLLILFHEMAHILRGHFVLLGGASIEEASGQRKGPQSADPLLRRALELDADFFAVRLLGALLLRERGDRPGSPAEPLDLFFAGMSACYVQFSALAEDGPRPTPRYHSPLVRLSAAVQVLGDAMQVDHARTLRLFNAFLAALWESAEKNAALLSTYVTDAVIYNADSASLPQTHAKRADLHKAGKLSG